MYIAQITEEIVKHTELNPKLWTKNNELKPEVKDKILEIVDIFVATLAENEIEIKLQDVLLIGSNASFNYTDNSDLDIHLIADSTTLKCDPKLVDALYSAYRSIFNSKYDINFYNIPIELYVETELSKRISAGVYSVLQETWIKEPQEQEIPEIDKKAFNKVFKHWENKFKEIKKAFKNEEFLDESHIISFIETIYSLRKEGLSSEGEFSILNLVFKELRNKGYLDELKEMKNVLISQRLSLEESLNKLSIY